MSNHSHMAWTRPVAAVAVLSMALLPSAAMASGDYPLEPRESENSVAQSVQIRVNADGTPNADAIDFRWSVTQITAQGEPDTEVTVEVPEDGALLHSLNNFGTIPQEDGNGLFPIDLNDSGFGTARSVSLFPQDGAMPVELSAEFTLDGEPISAQDLVGKDGLVTATYTVTNLTSQEMTVPITSVTGDEIEKTVTADVPFVVQAETFLPQTFAGLNTGSGLAGADGRGNWQVVWIGLPFAPLSDDGTAQFGWSANVTDAVIPSMVIQALPIYIPEGAEEEETAEEAEEGKDALFNAVPPPDVTGDVASIKAGVADVIGGLEKLTEGGGEDPLKKLEGSVNDFFTEFGTNLQTTAALVDPNNPEGATAQVKELQEVVTGALARVTEIEDSGVLDDIDRAATLLTPANAQRLVDLNEPVNNLLENAELIGDLADAAEDIQFIADNAAALITAVRLGCRGSNPSLPPEVCDNSDAIIAALESQELQDIAAILNDPRFQEAARLINSPEFAQAAAALDRAAPILVPLADALKLLSTQLPGIVTTLKPVLRGLDSVLVSLDASLVDLSAELTIIGQGLADTSVDLPSLDAVLEEITNQILASEGGQQLTGGLDQVGGGIEGVKTSLGSYAAELTVALQAAKIEVDAAVADGKEAVGAVIDTADNLKAEVAGLVTAAHTSPLPYGGDPTDAPEGTKLAGAYEFRVDPANTEAPATLPRILISILLLVVAGVVGNRFIGSRTVAAAGAAGAAGAESAAADSQETAVIPEAGAVGGAAAGDAGGDAEDSPGGDQPG